MAAAASELVLVHGGADLNRLQARVEHVTAAPGPRALVRLHTRWGVLRLGDAPELETHADVADADQFLDYLHRLDVHTQDATPCVSVNAQERSAAASVLRAAAERGYTVAHGCRTEWEGT